MSTAGFRRLRRTLVKLGLVRPLDGRLLPGYKLIVGSDSVTEAEARRALEGLSLGDVLTEGREVAVEVRREVPPAARASSPPRTATSSGAVAEPFVLGTIARG